MCLNELKINFCIYYFYYSAFDVLSFPYGTATVDKLIVKLPHLFSADFFYDKTLKNRIMYEALYELFVSQQRFDVEQIRKDEALIIPANIDYTS